MTSKDLLHLEQRQAAQIARVDRNCDRGRRWKKLRGSRRPGIGKIPRPQFGNRPQRKAAQRRQRKYGNGGVSIPGLKPPRVHNLGALILAAAVLRQKRIHRARAGK